MADSLRVAVWALLLLVIVSVACGTPDTGSSTKTIGVSLLTRAPDAGKLDGLTFATTPSSEDAPPSRWRTQDRWASVLLVVLVVFVDPALLETPIHEASGVATSTGHVRPPNSTVTLSPGAARPHTGIAVPRCSTM